jgi:glutamate-1-semialdehyde 2,1-aminomutase
MMDNRLPIEEYSRRRSISRRLFERATKVMPNGTTRGPFVFKPYPFYAKRAAGCRLWDVDENEYIDYVNNYGPLILGHCHPRVIQAAKEQVDSFICGAPTEAEVEMAEKIVALVPGAECVQFFPSGTEACQYVLRTARAYSSKNRFVMMEGGYHGSSDSFFASRSKGIPKDLQDKVIHVPFNNAEALMEVVRKHKNELAAVMVEPVLGRYGIPPKVNYLKEVREITAENDVLLIFDEVVTGFRLAPGGAQELFGITADMCTFGKILGGGFACGAMTFSRDVSKLFTYPNAMGLEVVEPPLPHPGTFNSVTVSWAAGLATLRELTPRAYEQLEETGNSLRLGLKKILSNLGVKACITGIASLFNIHFTDTDVIDAKSGDTASEALHRIFDLHMLNRGINLCQSHDSFCSTPMTRHEVDLTLSAARGSLEEMRPTIRKIAPKLLD